MTNELSPLASIFIPDVQVKKKKFGIEYALSFASPNLSNFDFNLLSDIIKEWYSFPTLSFCFSHWKSINQSCTYSISSQLHVLLFNVRGLEERWEEVLLLVEKYTIDVLILVEIGAIDLSFVNKVSVNYKFFFQKGENAWGGVLMLFKANLSVVRVKCETQNICVVDVKLEQTLRLIGIYAPKSKTWNWDSLTSYITDNCSLLGDFDIDLDDKTDEKSAKDLIDWADSMLMVPIRTSIPTSLRSNRIIDCVDT
jgi:hypothetical protein